MTPDAGPVVWAAGRPPRPLPSSAVLWRIACTRAHAAQLLPRLARVPCALSGTCAPDGIWTLLLWAPGHNAAVLAVLVTAPARPAALVPAELVPDAPWWACGRALVRLLRVPEVTP